MRPASRSPIRGSCRCWPTDLIRGNQRFDGRQREPLRKIDTVEAATALQPHLRGEANLMRKLEIAEFLGRAWDGDGLPFAIEHMSERSLRKQAVAALAAIGTLRRPRISARYLRAATTPPGKWRQMALGRTGERGWAPRSWK